MIDFILEYLAELSGVISKPGVMYPGFVAITVALSKIVRDYIKYRLRLNEHQEEKIDKHVRRERAKIGKKLHYWRFSFYDELCELVDTEEFDNNEIVVRFQSVKVPLRADIFLEKCDRKFSQIIEGTVDSPDSLKDMVFEEFTNKKYWKKSDNWIIKNIKLFSEDLRQELIKKLSKKAGRSKTLYKAIRSTLSIEDVEAELTKLFERMIDKRTELMDEIQKLKRLIRKNSGTIEDKIVLKAEKILKDGRK